MNDWVVDWITKIIRRENIRGIRLVIVELVTTNGLGTKEKAWDLRVEVFKLRLGINGLGIIGVLK